MKMKLMLLAVVALLLGGCGGASIPFLGSDMIDACGKCVEETNKEKEKIQQFYEAEKLLKSQGISIGN